MTDDEILVLGSSRKKKKKFFSHFSCTDKNSSFISWIFVLICVALLFWAFYALTHYTREYDVEVINKLNECAIINNNPGEKSDMVFLDKEGVSNVPLHIIKTKNMRAMLTADEKDLPDSTAESCYLAATALEISPDGNILFQDFLLDKQKIFAEKKLRGYCAIINGNISIGISDKDDVMTYCQEHNGTFFRQDPLVIDENIILNERIKGKDFRRALAKDSENIYLIESKNKESLYDFSCAIKDLGITDAINLPVSYLAARNKDGFEETARPTGGAVYLLMK